MRPQLILTYYTGSILPDCHNTFPKINQPVYNNLLEMESEVIGNEIKEKRRTHHTFLDVSAMSFETFSKLAHTDDDTKNKSTSTYDISMYLYLLNTYNK